MLFFYCKFTVIACSLPKQKYLKLLWSKVRHERITFMMFKEKSFNTDTLNPFVVAKNCSDGLSKMETLKYELNNIKYK